MYKTIFCMILSLFLIGGMIFRAVAADYDSTNFTADGRKWQAVPSGHTQGKDNGAGAGTHNAGEDCGICHAPEGKAGNHPFAMAGTLYEDRAARRPLKGGEIILQDINGNVISMTSNTVGNFWTSAAIASDPYAVSSHGGTTDLLYTINQDGTITPADPEDSRTWEYKAWVKHGDFVRHMVTIAPVGGMSSSRMSCNMHHASLGSRGGLWGKNKNTVSSYPTTSLSFKKHVLPIFKSKCAPCHIPGETITRIVTKTEYEEKTPRVDYSSGKDFTSYAGSTVTTMASGVTTTFAKTGVKDLALPYQADPDSSPVLSKTKPQTDGVISHAGGIFWTEDDADYMAIRQWISEGAQNN